MSFEWQAAYSIGDVVMDAEHRKILSLCQAAEDCFDHDRRGADVRFREILNDLGIYANEHFRTEEAALIDARYPLTGEHQDEHLAYQQKLAQLLMDVASGRIDKKQVRPWLAEWWLRHILDSDMQYANFFKVQGKPQLNG